MNEKIIYQEKYSIKSSEVGFTKDVTLSSLLKIIQDLATSGSEIVGAGKDVTTNIGHLWVFTKLEINIKRMPKYLEDVMLYTYPNDNMHFIYPRTLIIKDLAGTELVSAKSLWVLIDKETRKVLLPKDSGIIMPEGTIKMEKISPIKVEPVRLVEKRKVRYSDLDINGHLNNTKYMDYIVDLFDSSFFSNKKITKLNLVFHQEAKENDEIDILASSSNTYFVFERDSKKIFECNIE